MQCSRALAVLLALGLAALATGCGDGHEVLDMAGDEESAEFFDTGTGDEFFSVALLTLLTLACAGAAVRRPLSRGVEAFAGPGARAGLPPKSSNRGP